MYYNEQHLKIKKNKKASIYISSRELVQAIYRSTQFRRQHNNQIHITRFLFLQLYPPKQEKIHQLIPTKSI